MTGGGVLTAKLYGALSNAILERGVARQGGQRWSPVLWGGVCQPWVPISGLLTCKFPYFCRSGRNSHTTNLGIDAVSTWIVMGISPTR